MQCKLGLGADSRLSDEDFIDLSFRMQERFFSPRWLAHFVQGYYVFNFSNNRTFVFKVQGKNAKLIDKNDLPEDQLRLNVQIKDNKTWLKIAQKRLHPLTALLNDKIIITKGTIIDFILYSLIFTKPYSAKVSYFQKKLNNLPKIKKIKKVLIINGSQRKYKGATNIYLKTFIKGIQDAGAEVKVIHVYEHKIRNCHGCYYCWVTHPGHCKFSDDVPDLLYELEQAHMIVLAFPTYIGNISSGLQKFLERCFPLIDCYFIKGINGLTIHPRRNQLHQQYLLGFNVYGFYELEQAGHLSKLLQDIASTFSLHYMGILRVSNCMSKVINPQDEIALKKDLMVLKQLGRDIIQKGKIDKRKQKKLSTYSSFSCEERNCINSIYFELLMEQQTAKRLFYRVSKRYNTNIAVEIQDKAKNSVTGYMTNISLHGCQIVTKPAAYIDWNNNLTVNFKILGLFITNMVTVKRHIARNETEYIVGLEIVSFDDEVQKNGFIELVKFHDRIGIEEA